MGERGKANDEAREILINRCARERKQDPVPPLQETLVSVRVGTTNGSKSRCRESRLYPFSLFFKSNPRSAHGRESCLGKGTLETNMKAPRLGPFQELP